MNKKKAAIYIRVSTLDQAREGYSLDAQERILRKWCKDRKYEVYGLYADRGISGRDVSHRPDMARLMRDVADEKFDVVIFWSISRFSRSVSDLYNAMMILKKHNVGMMSYTESFDMDSPSGRAAAGFMGVISQWESEIIGERSSLGWAERAYQGKRTTSFVLGYDKDGKDSFVINDREAQYVRFCFENYLVYKNLSELAKLCEERGYRGKRGRVPSSAAVRIILTNPIYCGYNSFKGEIIKGTHEPIISVKTYNKVQHILVMQGRSLGKHSKWSCQYLCSL